MGARLLLLVVSLVVFGFAPAPLPRKERQREDPTDVTGTWVFVRCDSSGIADAPETLVNYRIEMTRNEIAFTTGAGSRWPLAMSLDPGTPPSFTWGTEGRVHYVGSYRLHQGELTMIFKSSARLEERPTDFAGTPPYRYVMRRVSR